MAKIEKLSKEKLEEAYDNLDKVKAYFYNKMAKEGYGVLSFDRYEGNSCLAEKENHFTIVLCCFVNIKTLPNSGCQVAIPSIMIKGYRPKGAQDTFRFNTKNTDTVYHLDDLTRICKEMLKEAEPYMQVELDPFSIDEREFA